MVTVTTTAARLNNKMTIVTAIVIKWWWGQWRQKKSSRYWRVAKQLFMIKQNDDNNYSTLYTLLINILLKIISRHRGWRVGVCSLGCTPSVGYPQSRADADFPPNNFNKGNEIGSWRFVVEIDYGIWNMQQAFYLSEIIYYNTMNSMNEQQQLGIGLI